MGSFQKPESQDLDFTQDWSLIPSKTCDDSLVIFVLILATEKNFNSYLVGI